jgi:DNA adenine methylase
MPTDITRPVVPFLKWAGGKRWLTTKIETLTPAGGGTYIEPFAGSAAMFFHCRPSKAILSDTNAELIETYQTIKTHPVEVGEALRVHARQHSSEYYYCVRAMRCRTAANKAARFIYLNRTCWNGLYRVNLKGEFNVPKGTKTDVLLESDDFIALANLLNNAEILCSDFESQIDRAKCGDVIFADPPYTVRHNHNGFVKYNEVLFTWADQVRLKDSLRRAKERGAVIVVTNADHQSIKDLYESFEIAEVARYSAIAGSAARRGTYSELIIR